MATTRKITSSPSHSHGGFTLLEVMVSVSILSILFLLLFVPLLTSMNLVHQGYGDIQIQDALRATMAQIQKELKLAVIVYPNDGGRTTLTSPIIPASPRPYVLSVKNGMLFAQGQAIRIGSPTNGDATVPWRVLWVTEHRIGIVDPNNAMRVIAIHPVGDVVSGSGPYFDALDADGPPSKPCNNVREVNVLSRLDFRLPANLLSGGVPRLLFPLQFEPQRVTYYVRRRNPLIPFDERDNPLTLYRAQYVEPVAGTDTCHDTGGNSQDGWLRDSVNLEPVALSQTNPVGMHTALTPEDANIIARNVADPFVPGLSRLVADTSFETDDVNNDGRIDRVTINLIIGRFDVARRETVRQTLRQTVVLENTR